MAVNLNGSFVLVAQATGAEFKLFHLAVNHDGSRVNISYPAPVGMAFGVADIRTVNGSFPANIALQFIRSPLLFPGTKSYKILQNLPIHSNIMR
jgi:hypothetical protein